MIDEALTTVGDLDDLDETNEMELESGSFSFGVFVFTRHDFWMACTAWCGVAWLTLFWFVARHATRDGVLLEPHLRAHITHIVR